DGLDPWRDGLGLLAPGGHVLIVPSQIGDQHSEGEGHSQDRDHTDGNPLGITGRRGPPLLISTRRTAPGRDAFDRPQPAPQLIARPDHRHAGTLRIGRPASHHSPASARANYGSRLTTFAVAALAEIGRRPDLLSPSLPAVGAINDFRNTWTAARPPGESAKYRNAVGRPSPPWRAIACSSVSARPSCRYGPLSRAPQSGAVRHSCRLAPGDRGGAPCWSPE